MVLKDRSLRDTSVRELARRRPRIAFVLSGGGNLGSIQVGMLKALVEHEIVPDVVLGCSVGALNGAGYARSPDAAGVDRLVEHWRRRSSHTVMPSSWIPSTVQILRKGASLHAVDGLRDSLVELLGAATFDDLVLPLQCVAADVEQATEHWFDDGDLVQAILASAALPAVYPPVTIEGRRYMDGGVINNVPISRALDLGCRQIYVLHVGPHGRPDLQIRRPLDGAMLAYWVARNSRFARDLATLPAKVEAIVLPPGARPELRYDDFSQTDELVEQGYANASRFLEARAETAPERRRPSEVLKPLTRFVTSSRAGRAHDAAEAAASSPDGAVLVGAEDEPDDDPAPLG